MPAKEFVPQFVSEEVVQKESKAQLFEKIDSGFRALNGQRFSSEELRLKLGLLIVDIRHLKYDFPPRKPNQVAAQGTVREYASISLFLDGEEQHLDLMINKGTGHLRLQAEDDKKINNLLKSIKETVYPQRSDED